jgi:nitroreductase/NAD-dependent dihydropyrimidine dehydrogenase PreA subunit
MKAITIDHERCTLCGLCVKMCVRRILQEQDGKIVCTDPNTCIFCGHCKAVCPEDAPQVPYYRAEEFVPAPGKEDYPAPGNLLSFFRARRSMRAYTAKLVEREKLEDIIQAGRFAPTGGNRQHIEYVVIETADKLAEIRDRTMEILVAQADAITGVIASHRSNETPVPDSLLIAELYVKTWQELYRMHRDGVDKLFYHAPALVVTHFAPIGGASEVVDAGLAAMQMVLMAEAHDLGTCFIGFLAIAAEHSPELKAAMGIPEDHLVPVTFTVGYPAVKYERLVSRRRARVTWL